MKLVFYNFDKYKVWCILVLEDIMNTTEIIKDAIRVVNAFDQANTNGAIENMGSRGVILRDAIKDLRENLNSDGKNTWLTNEQAQPPIELRK